MDPAVAALDFAEAGAIIANMIDSYLAAGAPPPDVEGPDHDQSQDCRSSSRAAGLHLHPSVDDGASPLQSREHRAPVQLSGPSEVARVDSGADPDPRPGSRSLRRAGDQSRRLQDAGQRCGNGAHSRDDDQPFQAMMITVSR